MKHRLAILLLSAIGLISTPALADTYAIDSDGAHASINFKVNHLGFSWLTGRFNDFTGEYTYDPDDLASASVRVEIDTTSVDSNHAERDRHLRSDDFLNTDKHDTAVFESTEVIPGEGDSFQIVGDLTLHGETNSITIDAKKVGAGEDPWGNYRSGFKGKTEFRMKDFGMDYDLGEQSETVYLELHVEGVRQ